MGAILEGLANLNRRVNMAHARVITESDAQTIGWELAQTTADNHLDVWQRFLYQMERALPPDSNYIALLAAINAALFHLRASPCPYLDLVAPVYPEEMFRLVSCGIQLNRDNTTRLQTLLHEVANQLASHPATIPLYAFWDALDRVRYELTGDSPFGMRGEEKELER